MDASASSTGPARVPAERAKSPAFLRRRGGSPVIDFHTHIMVQEIADFVTRHRPPDSPDCGLVQGFLIGEHKNRTRHPRSTDEAVEARLADMDECGIDLHVISGHVAQYIHWADAKVAVEMHRIGNDKLAEFVRARPDRFIGMGMVPLQDTAAAVRELERTVTEFDFRAVQVATHVEGVELGEETLWPFWARAEALGIPVFIHPAGFAHPRFQKYLMWNGLGQPIEEALAMSSLIYEGALERFPRLKLCVAHGGGFLPYYAGRVDRNYVSRPEETKKINKKPSEYMRQFYYDTAVYSTEMLEFLSQKVGPAQILLGADYPVGEDDPVAFVDSARLSAEAKSMILGGNAAKLLGIAP
jgi:aminocarboxymuconate-semialdehyde decarboxylase